MKLRTNLRIQLLLALLVLPVLALAVVLRQATVRRQEEAREVLVNVEHLAAMLSSQQAPIVEGARQLLTLLAIVPEVQVGDEATCSALLRGVLPSFPQYANLGVVNPDGTVRCSALPPPEGLNLGDRPYVQEALTTGRFAVGHYQMGRITGRPTLNFGQPVLDDEGRIQAVVFGALDLGWLAEMLAQAGFPEDAQLLVTDAGGHVLIAHPPAPEWIGRDASSSPVFGPLWAQPDRVLHLEGADEVERLLARADLQPPGGGPALYVAVAMPAEEAFHETRREFSKDLGILGGLLLMGVLIVSAADFYLLRRLERIGRTARAIARGDLGARTGLHRKRDPIGELAGAFDEMAAAIQAQTERLAFQATHDPLTGLPNRAALRDRLQAHIQAGERVGVYVVIVERLHEVVNTLGHPLGDELLKSVGPRLQQVLGPEAFVARVGGGEFGVVLRCACALDEVSATARLVREAMVEPFMLEGMAVEPGGAVGVAVSPEHGEDADRLVQRAGVAAVIARRGSSGFVMYAPELDPYSPRRLQLITSIRHATEAGEMRLLFQPKLDLVADRPEGAEALVRWRHPTLGVVSPVEFIGLAEQTGVIRPLTQWVLRAAMEEARVLAAAGYPVRISANVSARDLTDPDFADQVAELLHESGAPPQSIELEVTEGILMADPVLARRSLARLRDMGLRLSIDDFGTGYSSLAYLRDLPCHVIKIDKAFIRGGPGPLHDPAITRSVIELGHNLGLEVIAEGVDTLEALAALRAMGCDAAQGDIISRPMDAATFEAWLRAQARRPAAQSHA